MNKGILAFLAVAQVAGSMAANALETLDYVGAPAITTVVGDLPPPTNPNGPGLTGDIVLASALNPNEANQVVTPLSYSFAAFSSATADPANFEFVAYFGFSTTNGKITDWDVVLNSGIITTSGYAQAVEYITRYGDSYTYEKYNLGCGTPGAVGDCFTSTTTSTAPGTWTTTAQAPEISPASAASGLMLLLGGLAVLRGRRRLPVI
jgi:hypothetical protein